MEARGSGPPRSSFVLAANHYCFSTSRRSRCTRSGARFIALVVCRNHRPLDWALDSREAITVGEGGAARDRAPMLGASRIRGRRRAFPEGIRVERFGDAGFETRVAWPAARTGALVAVAVTGSDQVLGIDQQVPQGSDQVIVGPTLQPTGTDRAVDDLTRRWAQ